LKFANLFVTLPHRRPEHQFHYETGRREYCETLLAHYELAKKVRDQRHLAACLETVVEHFDITLREMENVFAILTLYYSSQPANQFTEEFLVATLATLKVKSPQLYEQLRAGQATVDAFFQQTRLDQLKAASDNIDTEWAKKALRVCLMSKAEYEKAVAAEKEEKNIGLPLSEVKTHLRMEPAKIIPFLCSRLDRFALKPM